ncbi:hypothetical protein F2P56_033510, partial [Juglans regia]
PIFLFIADCIKCFGLRCFGGLFGCSVGKERRRNEQGKLASSMISVLGRLGKVDLAKDIFETARSRGYGKTVYEYSALISAYGRCGYCDEAIMVFDWMKKLGLLLNLVTYNAVIDACGKGGMEFKRALEIFDEMLRNKVQPDRIAYNSLLAGCSSVGLWEKAQTLFSEMVERGIDQDIFTYNTLLDAVCKGAGEVWCSQKNVCREMKAEHVYPNLLTYSTVIDVFSKGSLYREAMEAFREFKQAGLKADVVLYTALIDALCKHGLVVLQDVLLCLCFLFCLAE